MTIQFDDAHRERIQQSLANYVRDHFDHEMGELQSGNMLEFLIGLVGTAAYNQAIVDAQAWLQGKLSDLPGDLHEQVEYEG